MISVSLWETLCCVLVQLATLCVTSLRGINYSTKELFLTRDLDNDADQTFSRLFCGQQLRKSVHLFFGLEIIRQLNSG